MLEITFIAYHQFQKIIKIKNVIQNEIPNPANFRPTACQLSEFYEFWVRRLILREICPIAEHLYEKNNNEKAKFFFYYLLLEIIIRKIVELR